MPLRNPIDSGANAPRHARIAFEAYGVRAVVQLDDGSLEERVSQRLPFRSERIEPQNNMPEFSLVTLSGGYGYRLYRPDGEKEDEHDLEDALDRLASYLQIHVADMVDDLIFLHAGVVAWKEQAIVMPGRSFAGKTTLTRELVRSGAVYYSDEYAVLDTEGMVRPFARPLSIRGTSRRPAQYPVERLGGTAGTEPMPVGLVAMCEYRRGSRWRPELLSPGQGLLELMSHTLPARRKPTIVMDTLVRIVVHTTVVRTLRGEARAVAPRLIALLEP